MRIKQALNIFLLITFPLFGYGQTQTLPQKLTLKIAPLSLIDAFGNTSCVLSIETRLKNHYTISIDGGFMYHSLGYGLKNNKGWRSGLEVRRYLKKNENRYWATSFTYKNQRYNFAENILIPTSSEYEKNSYYTKQVTTFNVLYGVQNITNRFLINTYVGIGLRYKNTQVAGLTKEEEKYRDYGDSQALTLINKTGKRLLPNFVLGFKLGWVLF